MLTKLLNIKNLLIKSTPFFNNKLLFDLRVEKNYNFLQFFITLETSIKIKISKQNEKYN